MSSVLKIRRYGLFGFMDKYKSPAKVQKKYVISKQIAKSFAYLRKILYLCGRF